MIVGIFFLPFLRYLILFCCNIAASQVLATRLCRSLCLFDVSNNDSGHILPKNQEPESLPKVLDILGFFFLSPFLIKIYLIYNVMCVSGRAK